MATTKKAKYTKAQGTKVEVSTAFADDLAAQQIAYADLSVTIKDPNFQGGQSEEMDATVLASTAKEPVSGLPDNGTFNMSGNWKTSDAAQKALLAAHKDQRERAFRVTFSDGSLFRFIGYVTQFQWQASVGGLVTGSFSVRVSGEVLSEDGSAPAGT